MIILLGNTRKYAHPRWKSFATLLITHISGMRYWSCCRYAQVHLSDNSVNLYKYQLILMAAGSGNGINCFELLEVRNDSPNS